MAHSPGKYEKQNTTRRLLPFPAVTAALFLTEVFGFLYLQPQGEGLPLQFGLLWSVILSAVLFLLPRKAGRIGFGVLFGAGIVYAVGQTGYYQLFGAMMWLSDFRYASEGADYLDVLLSYPVSWFLWILGLIALGGLVLWKYPRQSRSVKPRVLWAGLGVLALLMVHILPQTLFLGDSDIRYAKSDYGRMQSAEAVWENLFSPLRLYELCGLYQTAVRDLSENVIYPMTPGYLRQQETAREEIGEYFADVPARQENAMTGLLEGRNVVLVLMESMDDWMIGDHTPTIARLMSEGITFTDFYTPPYGGIRTFNTEFCINTGSFLSAQGGYAFDYVTNDYPQSLASQLRSQGYSAKTFHYNDPSFYSRGVFSQAMGYEEYVCYADYLTEYSEKEQTQKLYDDLILFSDPELRQEFFRDADRRMNFIITRSAHLSYKYNEVLSYWGLKKYPEYRGMTGNEETDCALLKARLVDDLFQWLLMALEEEGELENTVIIGVTDHYTYGYKDEEELLRLSGVEEKLLLEKTPCFIWSPGLEAMEVSKTLNTADLLPTVLNLLGVESPYVTVGRDSFDDSYPGWVLFADGSWISGETVYDAGQQKLLQTGAEAPSAEFLAEMADRCADFTRINTLILNTDYYARQG